MTLVDAGAPTVELPVEPTRPFKKGHEYYPLEELISQPVQSVFGGYKGKHRAARRG